MSKLLIFLFFVIYFSSCFYRQQYWEKQWKEHSSDFKKVVQLFKENKLKRRTDALYKIPDSINLNYQIDKYVFINKDSANDKSYTLSFYLDSNIKSNNNHMIVYTDNNRIVKFYQDSPFPVTKIENNWYYVNYKVVH